MVLQGRSSLADLVLAASNVATIAGRTIPVSRIPPHMALEQRNENNSTENVPPHVGNFSHIKTLETLSERSLSSTSSQSEDVKKITRSSIDSSETQDSGARRKGAWSLQEDELLKNVLKFLSIQDDAHYSKWSTVSSYIPGRSAKQCRERWCYNLDPSICKEPWSKEEDSILLESHRLLGNRWAQIASQLPGRTENSVKTRYKSIVRAKKREWTKEEDEIILKMQRRVGCKWDLISAQLESRTKNAVKTRYRQLFRASRWPGVGEEDPSQEDAIDGFDVGVDFHSKNISPDTQRRLSETSTTSSVSTVPVNYGPAVLFSQHGGSVEDFDHGFFPTHLQKMSPPDPLKGTSIKRTHNSAFSLADQASEPQKKRTDSPFFSGNLPMLKQELQKSPSPAPFQSIFSLQRPDSSAQNHSLRGTSPTSNPSPMSGSTRTETPHWHSLSTSLVKEKSLFDLISLVTSQINETPCESLLNSASRGGATDHTLLRMLLVQHLQTLWDKHKHEQQQDLIRAQLASLLPPKLQEQSTQQEQLARALLDILSGNQHQQISREHSTSSHSARAHHFGQPQQCASKPALDLASLEQILLSLSRSHP